MRTTIAREHFFFAVAIFIAIVGMSMEFVGGTWDTIIHATSKSRADDFWSVQHVMIYSGLAIISCSVATGLVIISVKRKQTHQKNDISKRFAIVIIGSTMQVVAGYSDWISHKIYGIDAMLAPSHLFLYLGALLIACGSLVTLRIIQWDGRRIMVPVSALLIILLGIWIVFNSFIFFQSVLLCLPIFEILSSGCELL